jgi:hypothetical protein
VVANGWRAAAPFAPQFLFGLQPVFAVTAGLPTTCVKQLMGPTGDLIGILLLVDEQKLMLIEVRQPFSQPIGRKRATPGKLNRTPTAPSWTSTGHSSDRASPVSKWLATRSAATRWRRVAASTSPRARR